ncbi:TetR/AcrR family transcriptional regulator [Streptomyces zagrosensis]|uniref:AcrR family transcriptional regulator n=1 Tax=Streptomyces zagrosensis TaxID=1042984 RepID=A0A7W9Q6H8_9ACTN|nr:TetR/AcrR family transcriptional regulator C-terminal domain-containing protein [Streptomyces zagrosensis]MBB5934284.1 AcrR family transcriptional regulator [Streptomyces zagrosensis]
MATGSSASRPRTSVWLTGPSLSKRKADQPAGLDREKIIAATVRLLDAEGMARFSMRRLATELGVTAMSVYWYVATKNDLLELALDKVNGEMRLPYEGELDEDGNEVDWRGQLRQLAGAYRKMLVGHPWVSQLVGEYLNIGPNAVAFSEAAQRVIRRSGVPKEGMTGALSAVFQFVYGFGTIEGRFALRCHEAGISQDDYFFQVMDSIEARPDLEKSFGNSSRIMRARGGQTVEEMRELDFTFALDMVIAGMEAMQTRAGHAADASGSA